MSGSVLSLLWDRSIFLRRSHLQVRSGQASSLDHLEREREREREREEREGGRERERERERGGGGKEKSRIKVNKENKIHCVIILMILGKS